MRYPTVTEFIEAKRDRGTHNADEIREFILGYSRGEIPDYQASAWLMAVYMNGLSDEETFALTEAMVESGATLDLSAIPGLKLDKHSTGGVGDKVTLAVVPILAAAGIPIAKMSGRGLGFTGGTIDKLESIPGFRVSLSQEEIVDAVQRTGACICAQTGDLVPADRKLYALRDVTGTVESIPLIAASIMSKKIAASADVILIDVKVGRGAFMKTLPQARELAGLLVRIGEAHGRIVHAVLTAMDVPLGRMIGNWLEVEEAAALLRPDPENPPDGRLRDEVAHIASKGLELTNKAKEHSVSDLIESGAAFRKLVEIVEAQGGDPAVFDTGRPARKSVPARAKRSGFVTSIDAEALGRAAMHLGAGRLRKDDPVDPLAGVAILAPIGSEVRAQMALAYLRHDGSRDAGPIVDAVQNAFVIADEPAPLPPLILGEIESKSL
ncbi:MAG: thymidine phosphorylase [Capsulimonadaceae bacterium]|nr:thymidine phosphorylase [Capsulimonadaceae bacterium]